MQVALDGFEVFGFGALDELGRYGLVVLVLFQLLAQALLQRLVPQDLGQQLGTGADLLGVRDGLQQVSPQQPSPPVGQAPEVVDEGVAVRLLGLVVYEDLEVPDGLRVHNQHLLEEVPVYAQGRVRECDLEAVLQEVYEGVQGCIRQELVVRVVVLLAVPSLLVDVVAFCFIEEVPFYGPKRSALEMSNKLLDQRSILEGPREDNLLEIEALDGRDRPGVGHPLDDLHQVDLPGVDVVAGHAHPIRAVLE